ncbi:DNA repair protein xrcc3 [Rhizophlyctis rosea]|uniref:DNA repair protein xrcc3 n=1 Tax=Rhizophlyctis rosea TaxID=64517 RepID=A0AAD5SIN9_9FUNG|nr:DNA repair protein xrcc3 [Rhizophlyctis rosea]
MDVGDLELHPSVLFALRKAGIETVEEATLFSAAELSTKLRIDDQRATAIVNEFSRAFYPIHNNAVSSRSLYQTQTRRLTLGDPILDATLGGGIQPGVLTEVYGRSAAGKTQLALQLSITTQLPLELGGLAGGVAYIATEQKFPLTRFTSLLTHYRTRFPTLQTFSQTDNLHILHLKDLETQHHILSYQLPALISLHNVRTVLIDSIAANFRGEENNTGLAAITARGKELYEIVRVLKEVATKYGVAVVCLNQVSDVIGDPEAVGTAGMTDARQGFLQVEGPGRVEDEMDKVKPTLGLQWSNMINVRLMLSRRDSVISGAILDDAPYIVNTERTLRVDFAPHLPRRHCRFRITEAGITGVT